MNHPPFDPNSAALPGSGLFGLCLAPAEAAVHVVPVPFDATTSYRPGTAAGPEAVLAASHQVDLYCPLFGRTYQHGLLLLETHPQILALQAAAFAPARRVVEVGGRLEGDPKLAQDLERVNAAGAELNRLVELEVTRVLEAGKLPCVLGGDHSVPFGAIRACARAHPGLGVLHFDAHADLRLAYEGFEWSHASILRNVIDRIPEVAKLVQVGVRDFCEEELELIERSKERIHTLFDHTWAAHKWSGAKPKDLVQRTLAQLPEQVYISFDVDGLDPSLCPSTGTPVPGGLDWGEIGLWLTELAHSGRHIVGFDLVEVAPDPATPADQDSWDAIVGARLLYRLAGCALATRCR